MQTSSSFIAVSLLCSLKERHKHRMELGLVGCLLTKMPAPTHGFYRSNSAIDCVCIAKVWKAFRLVCGHHKSRPLFFLKQGCAFSRFSGLPVLGRSTMIVTGVIAIHPTTGCHHCKRSRSDRQGSLTILLSSWRVPVRRFRFPGLSSLCLHTRIHLSRNR